MSSQFGSFDQSALGVFIQSPLAVRGYLTTEDDGLIPALPSVGVGQYDLIVSSSSVVYGYILGTTTWEVIGGMSGATSFYYTSNHLLLACNSQVYIKSSNGWTGFASGESGILKLTEYNGDLYGLTSRTVEKFDYATRTFSTVYELAGLDEPLTELRDFAVWGSLLVLVGNFVDEPTDSGFDAFGVIALNATYSRSHFHKFYTIAPSAIYIDGTSLVVMGSGIDADVSPPPERDLDEMAVWNASSEVWEQYEYSTALDALFDTVSVANNAFIEYGGDIVFATTNSPEKIYKYGTEIGELDSTSTFVKDFAISSSGDLVAVGNQTGINSVTSKILKYNGSVWSDWGGTSKPTADLISVVAPTEYRNFIVPSGIDINVTIESPTVRFLEVDGAVPSTGVPAGGTTVSLTGFRFTESTTVTFGGSSGTNVNFINKTTLEVDTPSGTGAVDIVVSDSGNTATLTNGFTYAAALSITSIDVTSGTTAGGTTVVVTGTGFVDGVTTVAFDRDLATSIVIDSSTQITCVTPAHAAGAVDVTVYNGAVNDALTNGYTYA